jgi:hypothetical protein
MGTSLINTKPKDNYQSLIKVGDNTSIGASLKKLSDGSGNDLPIEVATDSVNFTQKVSGNRFLEGFLSSVASATQIVLTISSVPNYLITGSGGQVIKLPDATTLQNGTIFTFNNNQSSGAITINNNSNTLVASVPSGGMTTIMLLDNAIAAGSWERHELAPSNVTWSTNTFDYAGSITSATWNGVAIADNRIASSAVWNAKQDSVITTNRQTASYTLVLSDANKLVEMNVATANNLTVPLNSSVAFPTGTQILISQYGAGQTSVAPSVGVTIRSASSWVKLATQYSGATLIKIATDEWYLFGSLTT